MPPLPYSDCEEYEYDNVARCTEDNVCCDSASEVSQSDTDEEDQIKIRHDGCRRSRAILPSQSLRSITSPAEDLEHTDDDKDSLNNFIVEDEVSGSEDEIVDFEPRPQSRLELDSIHPSEFIYPLSHYEGSAPPLPLSPEREVIDDFMREVLRQRSGTGQISRPANVRFDQKDNVEFDLSDFSIYLPSTVAYHSSELTSLQNLGVKIGHSSYCFDGILSLGLQRRYVQAVPFKLCSIGNYGQGFDGVGDNIWIQSDMNINSDLHYRLRLPSQYYARYHDGFLWLANLAKHFVDYLECASGKGKMISIHHFRKDFALWLRILHGASPAYQKWVVQYNREDFRVHIATNIDFLWKETVCISHDLSKHPIWNEVKWLDFIPEQRVREKRTIVTPYVFECFEHLKLRVNLSKISPQKSVNTRRKSVDQALSLMSEAVTARSDRSFVPRKLAKSSIIIGDVLAVVMDEEGISQWKDEPSRWKAADDCWYVLVQGIHLEKDGSKSFDVLWLYKPADTTCAKMKYPWCNELFLSDNCSCSQRRLPEDDVLYKVPVAWHGQPGSSDIFIRQTYLINNSFVSLKDSHKQCVHLRDDIKPPLQQLIEQFKIGDTVLFVPPAQLKPRHGLQPGEIVEFIQNATEGFVRMKRLLRRSDLGDAANTRPNELVYSDELFTVKASQVKRRCYVRLYKSEDVEDRNIPAPYSRDGTGDAFYITQRLVDGRLQAIHRNLPTSLIQGIDLNAIPLGHRLRGLDLFCGGGTFGRGLEEGGAIHNTYAVDLDKHAIHSYHANLKDPKSTKLFYGSVNDMLAGALRGNPSKSDLIPLPGEIDFISAGSPCPGFSQLTPQKNSEKGLRDQSLVASVAAYIDFYRPKYALLENVTTMAKKGDGRDEDVLSQLLCCLVGMGYQVQVFNLDAWSFGSPQTRSRLFVSVTAPELHPPSHPGLSHSHPYETKNRGLGRMANGHAFGERQFGRAPFEYVTAGEATKDLPDIGDGRTYQCIYHPDHQMARGITPALKAQIEVIPMSPRGMNFSKTWKAKLMSQAERGLFPVTTRKGNLAHCTGPLSKAWGRVNPRKLFPTIATSIAPTCSRTGQALHWNQQRLLTVLEARRAQSYPDEEVLVGVAARQWRIVGNSVARTVSLALGISIGEASRRGLPDEPISYGREAMIAHREQSTLSTLLKLPSFEDLESEDDSGQQFCHSLDVQGINSSTSRNGTSSAATISEWSDVTFSAVSSKKKRRRQNIPDLAGKFPHKKRLLGPASRRDPATLCIPDDEPPPSTKPRVDKSLKLIAVGQRKESHPPNDHLPRSQKPSCESTPVKKPRADQKVNVKPTQWTQMTINQKGTPSMSAGTSEVIDLVSDEDEGQDNESDDLVFISTVKKEHRTSNAADNTFIKAYERTYASVGLGVKRR